MGGSGPTLPHNELPHGTQKELQTEGVAKKQLPLICSTWMTKELSIPATPRHWLRRLIKITPGTRHHISHTTTTTIPRSKLNKTENPSKDALGKTDKRLD